MPTDMPELEPAFAKDAKSRASLTLEKGIRILDCFDVEHPEWSLKDLGVRAGVARPTAYRLVKTLVDLKYLARDPARGTYHLGAGLMKAAYLMSSHTQLTRVAHPFMEELAAETTESAVMAVWMDHEVLVTDVVITPRPFRPFIPPGTIMPGFCTAHAKLFLAFGPEQKRRWALAQPLERRTEHTVLDPPELEKGLEQVSTRASPSAYRSGKWGCAPWRRRCSVPAATWWPDWRSWPRTNGSVLPRCASTQPPRNGSRPRYLSSSAISPPGRTRTSARADMTTCNSEPVPKEARAPWVDIMLTIEFESKPYAVLIGARWLGEFAYLSRSGIYPGSRVCWRLPESLFERGGLVELALRETGAPDLDFRPWDEIGWTWTGIFNATTRDGKPHLDRAG